MNQNWTRPTKQHDPFPLQDIQANAPVGWCIRCGGELYRRKQELCRRCLKFERRKRYDK